MKTLLRAFIVAALATSIVSHGLAQDVAAPATPAPADAAPAVVPPAEAPAVQPPRAARRSGARTAARRPAPAAPAARPAEPVLNPEPGISKQNNVNVRGQAAINSEVVTHLQKNQPITLLEEITVKKPKQDEPARWYRIALPADVGVWVHSSFVDPNTKTVKATRLNMRSGPGENYSVLGRIDQGAVVNPIDAKGAWMKIQAPTNAYAFVAAHLVEKAAAPVIASATPPAPAPTPTPAPEPPPVAPPVVAEVTPATPEIAPAAPVTPPPAAETPVAATPTAPPPVAVVPAPAEVPPDAPVEKVKKIVSREGVLRGSVSIQAPSHFELRSLDTGKTINYVFSPSTNLMLKEFKGKRVLVTGEELLDERWQNTPVIIIDSFEVVP
jgi:uncharacterized protein YgiM (DUF1202 family)